jgi:hypothetical protein
LPRRCAIYFVILTLNLFTYKCSLVNVY